MKKKMIIAVVFVFALVITASVVFASYRPSSSCCTDRFRTQECCPQVDVDADNNVSVKNDVRTRANSGDNYVSARYSLFGSAKIDTGTADALADVKTDVAGSKVDVNMPYRGSVDVDADNNVRVRNEVTTTANSGRNRVCGSGNIDTGQAMSTSYSTTNVDGGTVSVY